VEPVVRGSVEEFPIPLLLARLVEKGEPGELRVSWPEAKVEATIAVPELSSEGTVWCVRLKDPQALYLLSGLPSGVWTYTPDGEKASRTLLTSATATTLLKLHEFWSSLKLPPWTWVLLTRPEEEVPGFSKKRIVQALAQSKDPLKAAKFLESLVRHGIVRAFPPEIGLPRALSVVPVYGRGEEVFLPPPLFALWLEASPRPLRVYVDGHGPFPAQPREGLTKEVGLGEKATERLGLKRGSKSRVWPLLIE